MRGEIEIVDVAHAIQLAVAPVFLLSGVGVILGVLTGRLARIVDRARAAEDGRDASRARHARGDLDAQLRVLARRARHINIAITLITITALFVVAGRRAAVREHVRADQSRDAGGGAVRASMVTLVVALVSFLLEVRISIASLTHRQLVNKKKPRVCGPGRVADSGRREGKSPPGEPFSSSVQTRPLQHLHVAGLAAEVARDHHRRLLQLAAPRGAVELYDAAVLLESTRIWLVDQKVRVVLDAHVARNYRCGEAGFRDPFHTPRGTRAGSLENMTRYRRPEPPGSKYITPEGARRLREELDELWRVQRPQVTRAVAEAAAQGDRSENAEYIYGKKQLREIDRRVRFLRKRLEGMVVVRPATRRCSRIFFGAWVQLVDDEGAEREVRIVGPDEIDPARGYISMDSPLARALMGRVRDDEVRDRRADGRTDLTVVEVRYAATTDRPAAPVHA